MPTFDEELRDRIARAVPTVPSDDDRLGAIVRRKRLRTATRKFGTIAVVATVLLGTIGAFALLNGRSQQTPGPADTSAPSVVGLGLPFPTCRVSSMPISTDAGDGSAYVFTEAPEGDCPKAGDGTVGVGVDVDGDGVVDATSGPLPDCWFQCEAFAAPDVDGDGVSEVAVSTEGADGYGISLYAVTTSPSTIEPMTVSSTFDTGPQDGGPLQFAWVDVATHASSAGCVSTGEQGPFFVLYSTEKLTPARVQTTSILIEGSTATVTAISTDTMPSDQAPMPGRDLCEAPIYGSAAGLGTPVSTEATTIPGVPFPVCRASSLPGNFGPGLTRAWFFEAERAPGSGCANSEGFPRLAVGDDTSVAFMSAEIHDYMDGTRAWLYATPDLNADGTDEIALGVNGSAEQGFASIALYRSTGHGVVPITLDCGPACDPVNWIDLGAMGALGQLGALCSNEFGGQYGLVPWRVKEGTSELNGALWIYDNGILGITDITVHRTGEASTSLPDGTQELCGSPVHWPEESMSSP